MVQSSTQRRNALHELGYKIFLDRYAQKDMTRSTLAVGDTVIVVVNSETGQREIGTVKSMALPQVTIELLDGEVVTRDVEHVDKPLETDPAQMMERVARGIAAIEKTPELQAEWTEKFQWLLEDFKFVPAGRILAAAGTDQKLTYYNCMPPEQEILTEQGYKPIAEVKVGDLVVTHRNRLRPVRHKFERETEELLYIIKPKKIGYDDLRVTGDHKILIIRSEWVNKHRSRDGLRLAQEPAWIPAKEVRVGDYVAAAYDGEECPPEAIYVSQYVENYDVREGKISKATTRGYHGYVQDWGTHYSIYDRLELDGDLCYLFGRWLGDGCVTHRTGTDIPSGIKIVFGLDEKEEAENVARIIEEKFGIEPALKLSSTERWYDLWVNSMPLGQFFKAFLGVYSYGKRIPEELMHMPRELTLELLHGLFSADGYVSGNYLGILLANRHLTIQIHQLLLRVGYLFSITENTHRLGKTPSYRVTATVSECKPLFERFFRKSAPATHHDANIYIEHDGLKWVRINEIAVEDYSGAVMDIEVEEDHSFVSAGVVVSNCYVIPSPKDSRGGIIETLRQMTEIMSRGGGVGINISSLRPRHGYVKGVNGRSSGSVSWGALYSFVTGLIEQGGSRRGALMLILNDWHPDVFDFINSKRTAGKITNANISVGVSDKLMEAVKVDGDWDLVFPDTSHPAYDAEWNGELEQWLEKGYPVVKHRTVKAREVWNAITESAWASAEPGVWFRERSNKMSNSYYYASLVATNPCGEQSLAAWSVCNLGAINLARFYDEDKQDVKWDDLDTAVRYATRFLDNVIDSTPYFFEENAKQQLGERRVGLNNMGLAELMIRLGIRYGSDESVAFIDKLYAFIARAAYETSIELAQEKGPFPQFDSEKFIQSGFMQSMPKDIREKVRKRGIRNVTLLTQAPTGTTGTMVNTSTGIEPFFSWVYYRKSRLGLHEEQVPLVKQWYDQHPGETQLPDYYVTAMDLTPEEHVKVQAAIQRWVDSSISKCVVGDTLILTDEGLQAIEELSDWREPDSFSPLHVGVMTSNGSAVASAFYYNGMRPTIKVKLSYGYGLEGTTNHPIRVLQSDGTITFKQLGDLRIGDVVPVYMGQRKFGSPNKPLPAYEGNWNVTNTKRIQIPTFMTNDLAYLLGCITSEGSIGRNSVHFVNGDRHIVEAVARLFEDIFGIQCLIEQDKRRDSLWYVRANSRVLCRWLTAELGLMAGASNKTIPACILTASAEEIAHFLRGLFLDAYVTLDGRMFGIGLASLKLLQQLQVLFLNFGIVSRLHKAGPKAWALTAAGESLDKLAHITTFEEIWKNERIARRNEMRVMKKYRNYATYLPATLTQELDQAVKTHKRSLRSLYPDRADDYQRVRVALMNKTKIRRDDASEVYSAFHETSSDYLNNFFASDSEQCIYLEVKELQAGFAEVFDITVPDSHEFIANGICNHNTANLPNSYTVEQTRKLYEYMYELGCKGGTVYRDGSRDEQVLMLKGDERAESEKEKSKSASIEQVTTPHYVYPRPKKLTGVTVNCKTPYGAAYITMNTDEQGHPFEVFITAPGKAGSDLHADAEGIGRLISLQLRTTAPQNRMQMLKLVIDQLKDIRGSRSYGMGPNRVFSLPDAVAGALLDHFFPQDKAQQLNLFVQPELMGMNGSEDDIEEEPEYNSNGNGHSHGHLVGADICPSCGTISLLHVEGCKKCLTCGYSEC